MQPDQADAAYLWDMLTAARSVQQFAAVATFEDYLANAMMRRAIEREIEIIGESARQVSDRFRQAHPKIPWRGIIAQRHVLAHHYSQFKHDLIWKLLTRDIPDLIAKLEPLVPAPPPDPKGTLSASAATDRVEEVPTHHTSNHLR